jgi:hypothetical protein
MQAARLPLLPRLVMYGTVHKGWRVGPILSLAGVLVGGVGGFVVATTYDHKNPVERKVGLAMGVAMMLAGIGLFTAGWWL